MSQKLENNKVNVTSENDVHWVEGPADDSVSEILGFDLANAEGEDRSGLRALINSVLVYPRRLPVLDSIFDRAARALTTALRNQTNDNIDVALIDINATRFGDFLDALPEQSVTGVIKSAALDGHFLIAVDADLIHGVVDLMLGGRSSFGAIAQERGFTPIEASLAEKIIAQLMRGFASAFETVCYLNAELDRIETTARYAAVVQSASVCSIAKYRVTTEYGGGYIAIVTPHASLEPVVKDLSKDFVGEGRIHDSVWRNALTTELANALVNLNVVIGETTVKARAIESLSVGETLTLDSSAANIADVKIGDVCIGNGPIGAANGRLAVRIDDVRIGDALMRFGEVSQ